LLGERLEREDKNKRKEEEEGRQIRMVRVRKANCIRRRERIKRGKDEVTEKELRRV
jgi:hypothetical protein